MTIPTFDGIHHLKFPVADLAVSLDFYERALDARRIEEYDHVLNGLLFAMILEVPGLGTLLELRLAPDAAPRHAGFDPITLLVDKHADLESWVAHFERQGVHHSPILTGMIGWLIAIQDPDGRRIRFYTRETHGPELPVSWDSPWISG